MVKIVFEGWETGMRKIPFVKLLNEKGNLSLADAKLLKDKLVDNGEVISIEISDENLAKEILAEAQKLKVLGRIENTET